MGRRIVLASVSTARARLLREAGLEVAIEPADIDEAAVKRASHDSGALECAAALAVAKAHPVSLRHPEALTIGADQILTLGDEWFDKPADRAAAWDQLVGLRGRTHRLATAVCVCRAGDVLWRAASEPRLTMRDFSDGFLDAYIAAEGDAVLGSVGAYRLEGRGVQLFSAIEGDQFAIQGLPLVELLTYLREAGALST